MLFFSDKIPTESFKYDDDTKYRCGDIPVLWFALFNEWFCLILILIHLA